VAAPVPRGSWEGSTVTEEEIGRLQRTRQIPAAAQVACRAPEGELAPAPREGEHVVFSTHFAHGFGLPVSPFLRRFFTYFGLQPHHLGANAILLLSCFVTFCEAYLGIWPFVDLWAKLFYLRPQVSGSTMSAFGAASIYLRPAGGFPKILTVDSAKKWQKTFFYVKNVNPAEDKLNLPYFPTPSQSPSFTGGMIQRRATRRSSTSPPG